MARKRGVKRGRRLNEGGGRGRHGERVGERGIWQGVKGEKGVGGRRGVGSYM